MTVHETARPTRRILTIGLPLAVAGLVAAGCSSSASAGSGGNASPAPAASSSTTAPAHAAVAGSNGIGVKISSGHLTDSSGRTLYLWSADTGPASTCSAACLKVWPAVPASGTPTASGGAKSADLSTIKGTGGTSQLAYAGHPLYYFVGDKAPGDTTGQGSDSFGAKWWEVSSSGKAITSVAAPAGGSSPSSSSSSSSSSGGSGGYGY